MLEFMLIAAPAAIVISAVVRTIAIFQWNIARAAQQTTNPASAPQRLNYTVYAESGYNKSDNRYAFTLERLPQGYRCYIDRSPSYRGRRTDPSIIHQLQDSQGPYICYTADLPELEQAKALCQEWSNLTQRYIETGKQFNE